MDVKIDVVDVGYPFLLVFALAAVGYVAGGLLLAKRSGSKAAGLAAHPHYPQVSSALSLLATGTLPCVKQ